MKTIGERHSSADPRAARRRRLLLVVGLVLLPVAGLVLGLLVRQPPAEPTWRGRPLSRWIAEYDVGRSAFSPEALEAIRGIGTNGLPLLLAWATSTNSTFRARFDPWMVWPFSDRIREQAMRAYLFRPFDAEHAIVALGADAKPCVPELMRLLDSEADCGIVLGLLRGLGRHAVPDLMLGLGSTNRQTSARCARILGLIGPDASDASQVLMLATVDSSPIRGVAAEALVRIGAPSEVMVPLLVNQLTDESNGVRESAVDALGDAGRTATAAIPALLKFVTNSTCRIPNRTWKTIRAIDPTVPVPAEFK